MLFSRAVRENPSGEHRPVWWPGGLEHKPSGMSFEQELLWARGLDFSRASAQQGGESPEPSFPRLSTPSASLGACLSLSDLYMLGRPSVKVIHHWPCPLSPLGRPEASVCASIDLTARERAERGVVPATPWGISAPNMCFRHFRHLRCFRRHVLATGSCHGPAQSSWCGGEWAEGQACLSPYPACHSLLVSLQF